MGFFDIASSPSVSFKNVGDTVTGTITAPYTERQASDYITDAPKVDDKGRPVMMAVIELQTAQRDPSIPKDDGARTLYIEKFGQKVAVSDAIKAAGAKDLEVGGTLTVTYTGDTPSTKGSPLKVWSATYVRPLGGLAPSTTVTYVQPSATVTGLTTSAPAVTTTAAVAAPAAAADPTADLLKIRELAKLGFQPAQIHAALPHHSLDAIAAVLAL